MPSGQTQQRCARSVSVPAALPWPGWGVRSGEEQQVNRPPLHVPLYRCHGQRQMQTHPQTITPRLQGHGCWKGRRGEARGRAVRPHCSPRLGEGACRAPRAQGAPPLLKEPDGFSAVLLGGPTPGPQGSLITAPSLPRRPSTELSQILLAAMSPALLTARDRTRQLLGLPWDLLTAVLVSRLNPTLLASTYKSKI